jgi:ligand-binding SRPBCC domain-containing protein
MPWTCGICVMSLRTFQQTSVVGAPADAVWRRVTNFEGINAELMPVMRMRVPHAHRDTTVATVPVGVPLGRAWIFYFGFLPLDYDDLMITELEPGSHFQEVSTMLSMRRWEHRRELRDVDGARTEVTDTIGFEPRLPLLAGVLEPVLRRIFAHRHRRLSLYFADG